MGCPNENVACWELDLLRTTPPRARFSEHTHLIWWWRQFCLPGYLERGEKIILGRNKKRPIQYFFEPAGLACPFRPVLRSLLHISDKCFHFWKMPQLSSVYCFLTPPSVTFKPSPHHQQTKISCVLPRVSQMSPVPYSHFLFLSGIVWDGFIQLYHLEKYLLIWQVPTQMSHLLGSFSRPPHLSGRINSVLSVVTVLLTQNFHKGFIWLLIYT